MFKPTRQSVGMASGLKTFGPIDREHTILNALLNLQAEKQERDQAVYQLKVALDSLKIELEAW